MRCVRNTDATLAERMELPLRSGPGSKNLSSNFRERSDSLSDKVNLTGLNLRAGVCRSDAVHKLAQRGLKRVALRLDLLARIGLLEWTPRSHCPLPLLLESQSSRGRWIVGEVKAAAEARSRQ